MEKNKLDFEDNGLSTSKQEDWLGNILKSLGDLQKYEQYLYFGAADIFELFEGTRVDYVLVQASNHRYFIHESRKLLTNSQTLLKKESRLKINTILKLIAKLEKEESLVNSMRRIDPPSVVHSLTKTFFKTRGFCSLIREEFVKGLWRLLTPDVSEITDKNEQFVR